MKPLCFKKFFVRLLFLLITTATVNVYSQINFKVNPQLDGTQVIGGYFDNSCSEWPIFLVSRDNGHSWTYNIDISDVPIDDDLIINSVSCSNGNCTAVGFNDGHGAPFIFPILLLSKDNGQTWALNQNVSGFEGRLNGESNFIYCSENTCIVLGKYKDAKTEYGESSILFSKDSGESWKLVKNISGFPVEDGALKQVTCSNNTCVAVGLSRKNAPSLLLMVSQDRGESWEHPIILNLPANLKWALLRTVSCSGDVCVAAGTYDYGSLLLVSRDKGISWSYIKDIDDCPNNKNLSLVSVSCDGKICAAVGEDSGNHKYAIITSQDAGLSWSYVKDVSGLPDDVTISAVSCSNNNCSAVGDYFTGASKPLIVASHDGGLTWSNKPINSWMDASLNSVKCHDNECTAVGFQTWDHPVIVSSHDGGKSWSMAEKIIGFPTNMGMITLNIA